MEHTLPKALAGASVAEMARPTVKARKINSGVVRLCGFLLLLAAALTVTGQLVDTGLRRTGTAAFGVFNRIVDGQINAAILVTGSSRALTHFDPRIIEHETGRTTYNIGINGSQIDMQVAVFKTYLRHNAKPSLLVHSLDSYTFVTSHGGVYFPGQYLPYLNEPDIYDALDRIDPDTWKAKYLPLYGYAVQDMNFTWAKGLGALLGWRPAEDRHLGFQPRHAMWTDDFERFKQSSHGAVRFEIEAAGIRQLDELLRLCQAERIPVLLVYSPVYSEMQALETNRGEIFARFGELAGRYGATLWDYSRSPVSSRKKVLLQLTAPERRRRRAVLGRIRSRAGRLDPHSPKVTMSTVQQTISVRGKAVRVPTACVNGQTVVVTGRSLRVARIHDVEFADGEAITDPSAFIKALAATGLRADILTFPQKIYEGEPKHRLPFDWDNAAVAPAGDYDRWWNELPQVVRKNVRRAAKRGVTVEVAAFDDALVHGIKGIYDETPIRQGRRFWHYGKDLETIRAENGSYLERAEFIGAYCEGELIGFVKFVRTGTVAVVMQILCKAAHYDKRPMNALIAKAMEVCHAKGVSHLVYSKFMYGNKTDDMTEFKRRNGFVQMDFPEICGAVDAERADRRRAQAPPGTPRAAAGDSDPGFGSRARTHVRYNVDFPQGGCAGVA